MSLSTSLGNFLYRRAFFAYRPMYALFKGVQDRHEREILRGFVRPGDTVIDIGANIGYYTTQLSKWVGPKGEVHCFEPDPTNFRHLQNAVFPIPNTVLNQLAIGPDAGEIRFYRSHELNVDHRAYRPAMFEEEIRVAATSVDRYCAEKGLHNIRLIKIDIQGFELEALKGMTKVFAGNPELVLFSEFWPYGLREAGGSAMEYFKALRALGLHVYLAGKELSPLTEEQVNELSAKGKAYFNIVATRTGV